MHEIYKTIKREIRKVDIPENKSNCQRYFKETIDNPVQLKSGILRTVSNKCFKEVKHLSKNEILDICDELLESDFIYKEFFAFEWAKKLKTKFVKSDFTRFEKWTKNNICNWAECDHLCCNVLGFIILMYPELVVKTKKWTKSKSRWVRRASAVSLIKPVRNYQLLDEVFNFADILFLDDDDMVQKGYGWMLKAASNRYPDEVFDYVMTHKANMPRTALRYAIEKYPPEKRKLAMKR